MDEKSLSPEQSALVTKWQGLVFRYAQKFCIPNYRPFDDCCQEGFLALVKAALAYDPTRLSRYTGLPIGFMKLACLAIFQHMVKFAERQKGHNLPDSQGDGERTYADTGASDSDDTEEVYHLIASLTPYQQDTMHRFFVDGQSLKEIAAATGRTYQAVHAQIKTALRQLREL